MSAEPGYSRFVSITSIPGRVALDEVLPAPASDDENITLAPPAASLGNFDVFPTEIFQQILLELDIETVETVQLVNRLSHQAVSASLEYRLIKQHCPQLLRGIRFLGAGQNFSLQTLFDKLCAKDCENCKLLRDTSDPDPEDEPAPPIFGGYIYLLTGQRLCYCCARGRVQCAPVNAKGAFDQFGLTVEDLQHSHVPTLKFTPQLTVDWDAFESTQRREGFEMERVEATSYELRECFMLALKKYGSVGAMVRHRDKLHVRGPDDNGEQEHSEGEEPWVHEIVPDDPDHYRNVMGLWDTDLPPVSKFNLVIVRIPWLDRTAKGQNELRWGLPCRPCAEDAGNIDDRYREYLEEDRAGHIPVCEKMLSELG